ncbi:MAG: hypothetical protein WBG69_05480, partial [Arcobacteraceae bacterium]
IPYIASAWGFLIIITRLKQFEASRVRKLFAFIFASSLVSFYLGLQIYTGYVFKTYGVKKNNYSHHQSSHNSLKNMKH